MSSLLKGTTSAVQGIISHLACTSSLAAALPCSSHAHPTLCPTLAAFSSSFSSKPSSSPGRPAAGKGADLRQKRFSINQEEQPKRYDYEWVIVEGGQRMLARAPAGTKKWHLWSSYEDVAVKQLQRRRRAQQGRSGTWLVDVGGELLK